MTRKKIALAVLAVAAMAAMAAGLEKERRAEGGAEGALLKDGWRVRLVGAQVAEDVAARGYADQVRAYDDAGILDSDPYATELVGSVVEPLIAAAKDLYPSTRDWPWQWHLAETGKVNAFCMPGGRVIVLSGLLADEILGDDRDMLATILAHEVAHAILQHSREGMGRGWTAQGLAWTMAKGLKIGATREAAMEKSLKTALLDPKTRAHETEADILGLELMARAGFEPAKAVTTWERMAARLPDEARGALAQRAMAFLSDHPSDLDRLARMTALQPKAQPLAGKGKRWEWVVDGLDQRQAEILGLAAEAFGVGGGRFSVSPQSEAVKIVAAAEGVTPAQARDAVHDALWESGLSQGGAIQMAMAGVARGVGDWTRLERLALAWKRLNTPLDLTRAPELLDHMDLPDEDRAVAAAVAQRARLHVISARFSARLWHGIADELGKTRPKGAQALKSWLEGGAP